MTESGYIIFSQPETGSIIVDFYNEHLLNSCLATW
jgi:hypothetical protein